MFGRRRDEPEPEGRYYCKLVKGEYGLDLKDAKGRGPSYEKEQESHQRDVQAALDRGSTRGWKLINVIPSQSVSITGGMPSFSSCIIQFRSFRGSPIDHR